MKRSAARLADRRLEVAMPDTALAKGDGPDLGTLPSWDLNDLYPGMDSRELKADLDRMETASKDFHAAYAGKLAALDGNAFAAAIREYERIDEVLSRIMSYAGLVYNGNMVDPAIAKFYQSAQERVNGISTHLVFFTLEINRLDERDLAAKLKASKELAHYAPWLRDVRLFREHQLSDEVERLLHEKHVVGRAAWNRLPTHPTLGENRAIVAASGARIVLGHSCDPATLSALATHIPLLSADLATGASLDI